MGGIAALGGMGAMIMKEMTSMTGMGAIPGMGGGVGLVGRGRNNDNVTTNNDLSQKQIDALNTSRSMRKQRQRQTIKINNVPITITIGNEIKWITTNTFADINNFETINDNNDKTIWNEIIMKQVTTSIVIQKMVEIIMIQC